MNKNVCVIGLLGEVRCMAPAHIYKEILLFSINEDFVILKSPQDTLERVFEKYSLKCDFGEILQEISLEKMKKFF